MRKTPRPQGTAGDVESAHPQPRPGRALAHTTGASGSGAYHRSDGRPPHTPRGARYTGQDGRPGTLPPVPGRSARPALLALSVLCAVLFILVTWQVAAHGPLRALDERAGHRLFRPYGPFPVAELCTALGGTTAALSVLVPTICWAAWQGLRDGVRRWWLPPLTAAAAMAAVPALVMPLKMWIGRPGPLGPREDYGWYPSGHAATAAVAYGTAALLLAAGLCLRHALDRFLLAAAALVNAAVGAGLVLRGYHWPVDVLGSWLLSGPLLCGVGWACSATGPDKDHARIWNGPSAGSASSTSISGDSKP